MAGYIGSRIAGIQVDGYTQSEADAEFVNDPNAVITVSGSNVGIGTTTALSGPSAATALRIGNQINIYEYDDGSNPVQMNIDHNIDANENYIVTDHAARYQMRDGVHRWLTVGSGTSGTATNIGSGEAMRIDNNGNLLVGTTSNPSLGKIAIDYARGSSAGMRIKDTVGSGGTGVIADFYNSSNVSVGSITHNSSSTSFNTTSDYRLKENLTPLDGAADRLAQIPVHRFNFIADPDTIVDGFLAHEVQAIVPEAVTGEKDAVDVDGNPVYQGIDQSKLVPLLTAALQEALQKIDALEARVAALEAV